MVFDLKLDELEKLVEILPKSGIIILQGDLASGKTTLVKRIVKSAGFDENVTSPTFSVMQIYGEKIFHYDIYQHGFEAILRNGLFENLFESGLHLVEWGDDDLEKALKKFEQKFLKIKISPSENGRKYEVFNA
ncbi:MAG: tRNA (adenosine(37)-N6)-threonylcarbamoyltransferase complex ATPase subunit type 1 TsaE [Campylobacter sp.]